jgi:hypothetical protein
MAFVELRRFEEAVATVKKPLRQNPPIRQLTVVWRPDQVHAPAPGMKQRIQIILMSG